jgi:cobalt-zinc-cadmium efflux system outer membrane protein
MTLADAEQMALAANPSVARAAALVEAARGNWIQVGLPPNPSVGYEGQQIGSGGRAEQDGVFVEQEFVRGGKLGLNRQVAAQEWARREQELAAQQQRVVTDVRIAFYHVLIAQLEVRSLERLKEFREQSREHPDRLLAAEEISRQERYQLQIELENAQNTIVRAENRRTAAWKNLATIMGHPDLPPQALEGEAAFLPEMKLDREAVVQRLLTSSPEIAAAMTNIERARWAAERALVERTPNVTVQGLVNWRDNGIGGDPDGAITVGLPMPLWNRNQGGIRQAAQEAAAAERALDQLELNLQNRLASIYERYASAYDLVAGYERAGGLRELDESIRRTISLWPMQLGTPQFLIEFRAYSEIRANYFEALRELRSTEAEIEGLLLSGSLENRQ